MSRGALLTLCERGQLERALQVLWCMESAAPIGTYLALLQACNQKKTPSYVKQLHAHLSLHKVQLSGLLGDYLVVSLAKCGALDDAILTSLCLPCRTVFSWTSIITACVDAGRDSDALTMHHLMKDDGILSDSFTFVSLLKACAAVSGLHLGKQLHVAALWQGFASDVYVSSALIHMYGKCGAVIEAELLFCSTLARTVVSWSALLSAYVEGGQGVKALQLYRQMHHEGVILDEMAFMLAIQACCSVLEGKDTEEFTDTDLAYEIGRALHADAKRRSFLSDVYFANTLVNLYSKSGAIKDAEQVFQVAQHDIVSWNAMLSAYVEQHQGAKALQWFAEMHRQGACPDRLTFVFAIQACVSLADKDEASSHFKGQVIKSIALQIGQMLHMDACTRGFASDGFVGSSIVKMYGKCGAVVVSEHIFTTLLHHDIVSWNSLMLVYVEQAQDHPVVEEVDAYQGQKPLLLFRQMQNEGINVDQLAYALALQTCIALAEKDVERQPSDIMPFEIGQALHADALRKGFTSGPYIGNRLMTMYGKCGAVQLVEHMFCSLSKRMVSAWNALLSAYVEQGQLQQALQLYRHMLEEGCQPDKWTLVLVLQVCANLGEAETPAVHGFSNTAAVLELGRGFHEDALKRDFASDAFIGSTLISMYGKCGAITEAEDVFHMSECTIVSRTALISAYVEQNQGKKALQVYRQMLKQGVILNCVTLNVALQACSATTSLESCKQIHFDIVSAGCDQVPTVAATLMRAYGSCASMVDAQAIFSRVEKPGIALWNACISGFSELGNFSEVMYMYEKLKDAGVAPDKITFTAVLSACRHTGLVGKGLEYFHSMHIDYGLVPDLRHFGSMMDLLGRVGDFHSLNKFWNEMPMQAYCPIWLCLLCACCTHGNIALAEQTYNYAMKSQPGHVNSYLLTSRKDADVRLDF